MLSNFGERTTATISTMQRRCTLSVALLGIGVYQQLEQLLERVDGGLVIVTAADRQQTVMRQQRLEAGFVGLDGILRLAGAPTLGGNAGCAR